MTDGRGVVYVIGFSAPPVLQLDEFLWLLRERNWDSYVILSPTAATWADVDRLTRVSGHPVRVNPRLPQDADPIPPADSIIAAPLTFNSLNKWALGISDTLALGVLNEGLGLDLSITAVPCANNALRRHPAYEASIRRLVSAGVEVLDLDTILSRSTSGTVTLDWTAALRGK